MYSFLPSPMPFYSITRAHLAHSTHLSSPPLTATQTCTHIDRHSQTQLTITFPVTHIPSHHPHPISSRSPILSVSILLLVLAPTLSLFSITQPSLSLSLPSPSHHSLIAPHHLLFSPSPIFFVVSLISILFHHAFFSPTPIPPSFRHSYIHLPPTSHISAYISSNPSSLPFLSTISFWKKAS